MPKMTNQLTKVNPRLTEYITNKSTRDYLVKAIGDNQRASGVIMGVLEAIAHNPVLEEKDPKSILRAVLTAEACGLLHTPQMGHYYLIPYGDRISFQLGYKGLIHMFMKTGLVKDCFAVDVREGEMKSWNPLTQDIELQIETIPEKRDELGIIGIYAVMELKDGFKKGEYWTKKKIDEHAKATSKAFGSVFWTKFYDAMAKKTVLKSLLDKWAPKSVSVAKALGSDDEIIDEPLKESDITVLKGEVDVLEEDVCKV